MCLCQCLWKRLALESVDCVEIRSPSPMWMGIIQFIEGLNRKQRLKKGKFTLYLSWGIHLLLPLDIGTPGSWAFRIMMGLRPLAPQFSVLQSQTELHHWLFCSNLQLEIIKLEEQEEERIAQNSLGWQFGQSSASGSPGLGWVFS